MPSAPGPVGISRSDCLEVTDDTPSRDRGIAELAIGQSVIQRYTFDAAALQHFNALARDRAPIHHEPARARGAGSEAPIVQGLALASRFSRLIGMYLPGERAILQKIELRYRQPVYADRELVYRCTVARILRAMSVAQLSLAITMDGAEHVTGHCQCLVR